MQPTRKFLCQISTQLFAEFQTLQANDLGSGASGVGNKFLADDMTWKPVSGGGSGGGSGTRIDLGNRLTGNEILDMGERV